MRVDAVRHIASEGSVTVIDIGSSEAQAGPSPEIQAAKREVLTGLHACAMALSPNGRYLVVANAASDTLSVIDTRTEQVVETIWARQNPADLFGASPNALVFDWLGQNALRLQRHPERSRGDRFQTRQIEIDGSDPRGLVSRRDRL